MGENAEKSFCFVMNEETGKFEPLIMADFTKTECATLGVVDYLLSHISPRSFAVELHRKLDKANRIRSRKRFVKLLMSWGVPRNDANDWAKVVHLTGNNYQETYLVDKLMGRYNIYKNRRSSHEEGR